MSEGGSRDTSRQQKAATEGDDTSTLLLEQVTSRTDDDLIIADLVVDDFVLDLTEPAADLPALDGFATSWDLPEASRYRGWRLRAKRVFDFVAATGLLLLLAPLMAAVALAVAIESPGRVLFKQSRVGQGGALFSMFKFRSMYTDAEQRLVADPQLRASYRANDYKLPESCDPRLTRLGRFLRKSSLDELPQLFSVLVGDMSLVGPRPVVPDELLRARQHDAYVHAVPGITGTWQVEGRSSVGYPERCDYDNRYLTEWSLLCDIQLLLRTIPAVLLGRGAH